MGLPVDHDDIFAADSGKLNQLHFVIWCGDMACIFFPLGGSKIITDNGTVIHNIMSDEVHSLQCGIGGKHLGIFSVIKGLFGGLYKFFSQKGGIRDHIIFFGGGGYAGATVGVGRTNHDIRGGNTSLFLNIFFGPGCEVVIALDDIRTEK